MQHQSEHIRLYEEMLQCTSQLLEWAESPDWDEDTFASGPQLQQQWNELQQQITRMESKLADESGSLASLPYSDELLRIAKRIEQVHQLMETALHDRIGMLGKSMKGLQDTKHLVRAYNDAGQNNPMAYFFDEKK